MNFNSPYNSEIKNRTAEDPFSDLLWEESTQAERHESHEKREFNLSSEIENYLRRSI